MRNFKLYLTWSLAAVLILSTTFLSVPWFLVRAQNNSDITYKLNVSTHSGLDDIGNVDKNGNFDKNAILTVDIAPIVGLLNDNVNVGYVVNIYDVTNKKSHDDDNLVVKHYTCSAFTCSYWGTKTRNLTFNKNNTITWNHTYDVIVELRQNSDNKNLGSATVTQAMGPAPTGIDNATTDTNCALQNLKWYPSGKNQIILTWTLNQSCGASQINFTYPDEAAGNPFYSLRFPNDHGTITNATSGMYTFKTMKRDGENLKLIGTAKINVVFAEAQVPTNNGTDTFDNVNNAKNATTNSSANQCDDSDTTVFGIPGRNINKSIASAICNMQLIIINFESVILGWIIQKVLYPSLGLPEPGAYDTGDTSGASAGTDFNTPIPAGTER